MKHSSCCNTNLLDSWWAINNKCCVSSGSELKLCMPIAYQHPLTFIVTHHTQNKFPITFNQDNKVVFIISQSLSLMALLLVVNLFISTCYKLLLLAVAIDFSINHLSLMISPSTTSASSCSSISLSYRRLAFLSLCIMHIPYLTDMGLLGSVLCSPLGFYCTPHWICCCWLAHWGAPSRAECILPNKVYNHLLQ